MEPRSEETAGAERAKERPVPGGTSTGLEPRLAAVLCYSLLFVSGVALLVLEKENRFVRFHALQSTLAFGALFVVYVVAGLVPLLGPALAFLLSALGVVLWLHLMYRAWQGQWYKLPWVGDVAEEQLGEP
jgi:uncharacterized membrane protein